MVEWVGIGILAIGLVYSWLRNGAASKKAANEAAKQAIDGISACLTETERKLTKEIWGMKETCAGARATLTTRLDGHDKDIERLVK